MSAEATETLTPTQRERRARVMRAALRLAERGGYDAVQMRDVASEADVALGTIYRYFSSKDQLLVAANVEWIGDLEAQVTRRPPTGDTTPERLLDVLGRALRALDRAPRLAAAVVTAQTTADGAASPANDAIGATMDRIMRVAFDPDDDAEAVSARIRTLQHVWFSCLVAWSTGQRDMAWVRGELDTAARLLH